MEKNLHNDPLDEYVRKSFESYEDLPPDTMWARVANAMDEEEERKPFLILWWQQLNRRLLTVAATALLLVTVLAGRYWYQSHPNTTAAVPVGRETTVPAPGNRSISGENTVPTPDNALVTPQNAVRSLPVPPTAPLIPAERQPATTASGIPKAEGRGLVVPRYVAPAPMVPPAAITEKQPEMAASSAPIQPENTNLVVQKAADLSLLPGAALSPLAVAAPPFPVSEPIIRPLSAKRHWYWSVAVARWTVKDHERSVRMGQMARRWAGRMERSAPSTEVSVRLGRTLNRHWGIESGVGYRTMVRSSVHAPRFRFLDGIARPGNTEYDFNYNLDTYGGSTEVTLRMEADNASLPPTEVVSARVRTRETINMLRFPLLLTWQARSGRFDATLKAGISAQYILRSSVEISQRESTSNRFRVGQYSAITRTAAQPFFLGYQATAGCRYRLSPRLSVLVEPSVGGDFTRKTAQKTSLPGLLTMGAFLGVRVEI
jgi:hypothetical protein